MSIGTYSELQTAVASWDHRADTAYTTAVPDFIAVCEADLQARAKLVEFEALSTVTITSGSGALPTGFLGARSVYWDGSPDRPITYIPPEQFDDYRVNESGDGYVYTITGSTIKTTPMGSGSVVITGPVKFTALSNSNTTNAILTSYPDVYLYGTLHQAALWRQDDAATQKWLAMFEKAIDRMLVVNEQRKYAGASLSVRAR
jgi:hypothetical protein